MKYWNKNDSKYINKILDKSVKRNKLIKKNNVFLNSEILDAECLLINNISLFEQYYLQSSEVNENEWYLIKGILKVANRFTIENKEYIYCDSKRIIINISNQFDESITGYTMIYIVPYGTVSFYSIRIKDKLSIR